MILLVEKYSPELNTDDIGWWNRTNNAIVLVYCKIYFTPKNTKRIIIHGFQAFDGMLTWR